jgi:methylenetetrahydrofolate reductase (NADPH)
MSMATDTRAPLTGAAQRLFDNFSLEVTAGAAESLRPVAPSLPAATPVSVTYLPGETMKARVEATALIGALGMVPVPHISARRLASHEELDTYLAALSRTGQLSRALVVGGDCKPAGPFDDALAVIRTGRLAAHGICRVGIGGYPEGHPEIPTDQLWRALVEKYNVLCDMGHEPIITTQFVFDAGPLVDWVGAVRQRGIDCTIRLGVPGPATVKALLRFAARCGVGSSTKVLRKYGISITRLMSVSGPDRLVEELTQRLDPFSHGEVRVHLYPFGGMERTAEWVSRQVAYAA